MHASTDRCTDCENALAPWEGAKTARDYRFATREIAHALIRVAQGTSYQAAALAARDLADRLRPPSQRPVTTARRDNNTHGQIVADWVEVFGPVLAAAYAPTHWPERLVVDAEGFRARQLNGARAAAGHHLWVLLLAVGYEAGSSRPQLWATLATGGATLARYQDFFGLCRGEPKLLVCDGSSAISGAARSVFSPALELYRCEWHLGRLVHQAAPEGLLEDPAHPVTRALGAAFISPDGWQTFCVAVADASNAGPWAPRMRRLAAWVARNDALITAQVAGRTPQGPHSVGAAEAALREFRKRIGDRAALLRNAQRTNALVSLMALDYSGKSKEREWAELIREHLARRSGRATEQRQHVDSRYAAPSLWI